MTSNIKKKRVSRQYYIFFFSCLASLIGLLVYILGTTKIPFPKQWLPDRLDDEKTAESFLFFTGISVHLQVNFVS
jgi:hypothetical protein